MDMRRHFILGSVHMNTTQNEMKFHFRENDHSEITPTMTFKSTCALNTISNESAFIHFISDKVCSHETIMPI